MKPLPILLGVIALCGAIGVISWVSQTTPAIAVVEDPDVPAVNPLTPVTSGPKPKAVLEEEQFDFGSMILGGEGSHAFVIRNDGEGPLTLKEGKIACKCTVPTIPKEPIPPGESAEVVMAWKPLDASTAFDKFAEIWTNDPDNEKLTLRITGVVRDLVQLQPNPPWPVSSVGENEAVTFEGVIASGEDSFEILSIEPSADWITVESRPLTEEELLKFAGNAISGYVVTGTVEPKMPVGRFEERIVIKTDLTNDYVASIPILGTRPGPFSILGQEWYGNEMTVRMGNVKSADGKSLTLTLFAPSEDEPIVLTGVESTPDIAQVTLERDDAFPAKVKEKYALTFTLPPGAAVGQYAKENRIKVHLTTNRASIPEINLSIDALIE